MLSSNKKRYEIYLNYLSKSPLLYRQVQKLQNTQDSTVAQISLAVLAPAINSFVMWILKCAVDNGIKRLYFLARDGYFMYRTAVVLCEKLKLPIECRYVYCSRNSVRIPAFHLDVESALEYICRGGIDVTIEKILGRSGLSQKEQEEVLEMIDIPYEKRQVIPYAGLDEIRQVLNGCSHFMKCMCRHSAKAMPALFGYLDQVGMFDGVKDAIVDSGWTGSMQKTLNQVLSLTGRRETLEGYYWGLYELPADVNNKTYHCYYFTPDKYLREKVYFSNCLFEAVFSAPHGMTLEYRIKQSKYCPVLACYDETRRTFMQATEKYIMEYTTLLAQEVTDIQIINVERDRGVVKKLLQSFMGNPTKEEADIYGALRFSDDVLDHAVEEVAAQLNEEELKANHVGNKALVMLGIKKDYIKESAWYEGSVARQGKNRSIHLRSYAVYKYLLYLRNAL